MLYILFICQRLKKMKIFLRLSLLDCNMVIQPVAFATSSINLQEEPSFGTIKFLMVYNKK
jgi:hypothetical protein